MESEWNLSDKIKTSFSGPYDQFMDTYLNLEDVREFIKRFEQDLRENVREACAYQLIHGKTSQEKLTLLVDWIAHKLHKLAGEKLI